LYRRCRTGIVSSPHTRGSSRRHRDRRGLGDVVPAHAGVIPIAPPPLRSRRCRPRTRGGHPWSTLKELEKSESSPHTRGSSRLDYRRRYMSIVVPAHAGVIRVSSRRPGMASSRPRTRGGHPGGLTELALELRSSPHTRGSSGDRSRLQGAPRVVPAHAGVIRIAQPQPRIGYGRPRTRGGHPYVPFGQVSLHVSSPHTRGSSLAGDAADVDPVVVPAHAGVIRCRRLSPPAA